jgi:hypothetical protein
MAASTRVNGTNFARGTLYDTLQIRAWLITPTTALTAGIDGTINAVAQEFGTTGVLFQAKSDGTKFVLIGDSHALDADTIDVRVTNVLGESCTVAAITSLFGIA